MKWKINFKQNDQIQSKFDSWQIYCENQDGQKLVTILLPQNVTEYLFTNLGRYPVLYDYLGNYCYYINWKYNRICFYLDVNVSYTMGLCMVSSGEATGCLTKHIETTQSDPSEYTTFLQRMHTSICNIQLKFNLLI